MCDCNLFQDLANVEKGWVLAFPIPFSPCDSIVGILGSLNEKMVINIAIQTEINKKENRLYPFKARRFHPNLTVSPLAGKFYARHDFADPSLADPVIEKAILKNKMMLPKDKYKEPATCNMEYGWYLEKRHKGERFSFHYPKKSCWITEIGALIDAEDLKMPKKIFNGVPFKV